MPTYFTIVGIKITYYSVLLVIGTAAGTGLAVWRTSRRGLPPGVLLDALPWVLLGGVVGARLFHIISPPRSMVMRGLTTRYYLTHFYDALAIWKGGFDIYGAVVGGILALYFFSRIKGMKFYPWADAAVPGACLGQAISSWGLYFNQELYGLPARLPWAIQIDPAYRLEGYQEVAYYHPLFLYFSLWSLVSLAFLLGMERIRKKNLPQGIIFYLYLLLLGLGQFCLEFLKLDISMIGEINSGIIYAGLFILFSGWGLLRRGWVNLT